MTTPFSGSNVFNWWVAWSIYKGSPDWIMFMLVWQRQIMQQIEHLTYGKNGSKAEKIWALLILSFHCIYEQKKMSNEWMCKFILEARRKDEVEYPPTSLYQIASGIIRLIKIMHHQSISSCSLNKFGNFYKQKLLKQWKELRYTKNASKNKPGRLKHRKMNPK